MKYKGNLSAEFVDESEYAEPKLSRKRGLLIAALSVIALLLALYVFVPPASPADIESELDAAMLIRAREMADVFVNGFQVFGDQVTLIGETDYFGFLVTLFRFMPPDSWALVHVERVYTE